MAKITIQLDTEYGEDNDLIARLFGVAPKAVQISHAAPASPVPAAPQAPAPAPKAAPQPKAEPVVEEPVEDLLGGEDFEALRKRAVDAATVLVSKTRSADVREILTGLGAKRVGDLTDEQLEAFVTPAEALVAAL